MAQVVDTTRAKRVLRRAPRHLAVRHLRRHRVLRVSNGERPVGGDVNVYTVLPQGRKRCKGGKAEFRLRFLREQTRGAAFGNPPIGAGARANFSQKALPLSRFGAVRVAAGQVKARKRRGCIALALGPQRPIGCVGAERARARYASGQVEVILKQVVGLLSGALLPPFSLTALARISRTAIWP